MQTIINDVIYVICTFITNIFLNQCYAKLNNKYFNFNKKNFFIMFAASNIALINNAYINYQLKLFTAILILCANFILVFKDDLKRTIVSLGFIYSIMLLIEIIISSILLVVGFLKNNEITNYMNLIKISLTVIVCLIEYIVISIPVIQKKLKWFLKFLLNNINILNIAYLMFLTIAIVALLNIENFANNSVQLILALIIIFAILFTIVIKTKNREEYLKKSNKKLLDYNENYGKFLDEYKIYKHNIKNKLLAIKTFGNKKVNALIDDLLEEETSFSIKNNNLYSIPNGIKGIVAEKLYNTKINAIINNKIKKDPFIKLSPKQFNSISESIGICLDNAIEASVETENPIVTLDLYEDRNHIFIKIGNNFCNNIDIDELGEKYYSTKNRDSGLGLFSIMRNKTVMKKISIINEFYYIELKIKKQDLD